MRKFSKRILENFGINLTRTGTSLGLTPKVRVIEALLQLRPKYNGFKLVRIGPDGDGGYLVPDDLEGIQDCLSPGCDLLIGFETDLFKRYGIKSHICDVLDKKPANMETFLSFTDGWIGPSSAPPNFISLSEWLTQLNIDESEKMMQMDIEGAEYLSLLALSHKELMGFRIIVIEFHFLEIIKNNLYYQDIITPLFSRLFSLFDVVHLHPNNCCGTFQFGDVVFPRIVEVTLHRKDRRKHTPVNALLPHPLDSKCVKQQPELFIDWNELQSRKESFDEA